MPARLDEFNKKFIYTDTNPENIIAAKKNSFFFRRGNEFYVNISGNINANWQKLPYRTVIIPPPPLTKLIKFKTDAELWIKTTDGYINEFKELLPKTGWKLSSYNDVFAKLFTRNLNWFFPVPASSNDPVGVDGNRSYDENYFYAKISGKWYRSPIVTYNFPGAASVDRPDLSTNLPFVDKPRLLPVPPNSNFPGINGDQTYDYDFFYVKVTNFKRVPLQIFYNPNKMTRF